MNGSHGKFRYVYVIMKSYPLKPFKGAAITEQQSTACPGCGRQQLPGAMTCSHCGWRMNSDLLAGWLKQRRTRKRRRAAR